MAFTPDTLAILFDSVGGSLFRMFAYDTEDSQATITTAGYFVRAGERGVKANDLILVNSSTAGDFFFLNVTALDSAGLATVEIDVGTEGSESLIAACSDQTTAITTGTTKIDFPAPYQLVLTEITGYLTTAQTSGNAFTVDVNKGGVSILTTPMTFVNGARTATASLATTAVAEGDVLSADVDQIGNSTAKGLKLIFKWRRVN